MTQPPGSHHQLHGLHLTANKVPQTRSCVGIGHSQRECSPLYRSEVPTHTYSITTTTYLNIYCLLVLLNVISLVCFYYCISVHITWQASLFVNKEVMICFTQAVVIFYCTDADVTTCSFYITFIKFYGII